MHFPLEVFLFVGDPQQKTRVAKTCYLIIYHFMIKNHPEVRAEEGARDCCLQAILIKMHKNFAKFHETSRKS